VIKWSLEDEGAGTGDNGEDRDDSGDSGGELGGTGVWPSTTGYGYNRSRWQKGAIRYARFVRLCTSLDLTKAQ